jgi:hypothetical protein
MIVSGANRCSPSDHDLYTAFEGIGVLVYSLLMVSPKLQSQTAIEPSPFQYVIIEALSFGWRYSPQYVALTGTVFCRSIYWRCLWRSEDSLEHASLLSPI